MENKDFIPSKVCSKCKEEKPLSSFCSNRTNRDGLHYQCKKCHYEINRRWNNKNKHKKARRNIEYRYNIKYEDNLSVAGFFGKNFSGK